MANIKSSEKDARRAEKRRQANQAVKSAMRTAIKKAREAAAKPGDEVAKLELFKRAQSLIDKAATKGVIKKQTASRYKSRLAHFYASSGVTVGK